MDTPLATRRDFVAVLRDELPAALANLQSGNIAPVDLAQAAIGPSMAVYTRYAKVLDAAGNPVSVREALQLINQILDEVLAKQEGDFDADSRWALAWFEQHGFEEGEYGVAETLSKAKNTSIAGIVEGGILASSAGKVRLLHPEELADDWDPATDSRLTIWEAVTTSSMPSITEVKPLRPIWSASSVALPKLPANLLIVSILCASARNARWKPYLTTVSYRAGRKSSAWRGRRQRVCRAGCSAMKKLNQIVKIASGKRT